MLIDRFLPRSDVRSCYETVIEAPPEVAYRAAMELDLAESLPVKALLTLRTLPRLWTGGGPPARGPLTIRTLTGSDFVVLGEETDEEIVIGVVGRFWKANSGIRPVEAEHFTQFEQPGYAKAAMNVRVRPHRDGATLTTETRVLCTDESSRSKFKLYWALIGPFSGFIRGEMLRAIKREAEGSAQASVAST